MPEFNLFSLIISDISGKFQDSNMKPIFAIILGLCLVAASQVINKSEFICNTFEIFWKNKFFFTQISAKGFS